MSTRQFSRTVIKTDSRTTRRPRKFIQTLIYPARIIRNSQSTQCNFKVTQKNKVCSADSFAAVLFQHLEEAPNNEGAFIVESRAHGLRDTVSRAKRNTGLKASPRNTFMQPKEEVS